MITTTTLGAFPKPGYVPITDWFSADYSSDRIDYTSALEQQLAGAGGEAEELFRRATSEVIVDQVEAGIDVVTDGEVRRENYVHHQCRSLRGIDFGQLRSRTMRGTIETMLPSVVGPVSLGSSPLAGEWELAQSVSTKPVKATLPGPMTIIDSTVDVHYRDDVALGRDLAAALNEQVRDLVAAGCTHIQIDEPVMARKPEVALAQGIEQLAACFDGVPDRVQRVVHCCCGYPRHLDDLDYPKADRVAYLHLAPALDEAPIDQVSIEDAHRHNDFAELLPRFEHTTVVLGLVAIASSRVEPVAEIATRLGEARRFLPDDRLIAAPDCGLGYLTRDLALAKLRAMAQAARSL